jgi:uncharacterized Zn-finger protein
MSSKIPPPETIRVKSLQVACDGSGEISPALGHPRVFLRIDEDIGFVECGYCDRRFVLEGGPADSKAAGATSGRRSSGLHIIPRSCEGSPG